MSSWGIRPIPKRKQQNIPIISSPIKNTVSLYTSEIAYNFTYEDTQQRISTFQLNNQDALITFIIPTINRGTLFRALESIANQSINCWKAIVIFDGCEPNTPDILKILSNNRFVHISINKKGILNEKNHGAAGFVRNIAMSLVNTPWIGFVDDDDFIMPNYTQSLIEETKVVPSAELICFRMVDNNQITPPDYMMNIEFGYTGISFCFKSNLFQDGFQFTQSEHEDFDFINNIKNAKKKIVISPYITYIVRDSHIRLNILKRVVIN